MTYQDDLNEYERLKKIYLSKQETHAKKFSATVVESMYQDSCAAVNQAYNAMRDAGEKVDIVHPIMI